MYAIVEIYGKQYKVQEGDIVFVDRIENAEEGSELTFDKVLFVSDGKKVTVGTDTVKGQGIGTEILKLTLQFAFEELKLHKVFARAFADNQASIKSFLKGGFKQEAYLKDEVCINGMYRDIVFLAILESEYHCK